jgi:chromosome segregation ATPase
MKVPIASALLLWLVFSMAVRAQTAPAQPAPAAAQTEAPDRGDPWDGMLRAADDLKAVYAKKNTENMAEVDRLLKMKVCQINRINGLIDRTEEALDAWADAMAPYLKNWEEAELRRVQIGEKSLAVSEEDLKITQNLIDADKRENVDLLGRKADLDNQEHTAGIISKIDSIIKDLQESETKLTTDQKKFDEVTQSVNNTKAVLAVRLIEIRKYKATVDEYRVDAHATYEEKRNAAQEICNGKRPGASPIPGKPGGKSGGMPD